MLEIINIDGTIKSSRVRWLLDQHGVGIAHQRSKRLVLVEERLRRNGAILHENIRHPVGPANPPCGVVFCAKWHFPGFHGLL